MKIAQAGAIAALLAAATIGFGQATEVVDRDRNRLRRALAN